jgi:hypothetical protein
LSKILVQTTIPTLQDDWNAGRFSLLVDHLRSLGHDVTARDRASKDDVDPVLATLDASDYDQLWLFAVDTGDGIKGDECAAIGRFRRSGRGIFSTRDHADLGISLCSVGGIGEAHFFHSKNLDPDPEHRKRDDPYTLDIDWPNFHSGANGDLQTVAPAGAVHPLLQGPGGTVLSRFPAHPHEGAVGAPPSDPSARVIATGTSKATQRPFNIAVAFEPVTRDGAALGAGLAESTFHHFCDYNWDVAAGCPSFVSEKPGDQIAREGAHALDDIKAYVANIARWLSPR